MECSFISRLLTIFFNFSVCNVEKKKILNWEEPGNEANLIACVYMYVYNHGHCVSLFNVHVHVGDHHFTDIYTCTCTSLERAHSLPELAVYS